MLELATLTTLTNHYEARPFKLNMELEPHRQSRGYNTGEGGVLDLTVTSVSNAANRSGQNLHHARRANRTMSSNSTRKALETEMSARHTARPTGVHAQSHEHRKHTHGSPRLCSSESFRGWNVGLIESA